VHPGGRGRINKTGRLKIGLLNVSIEDQRDPYSSGFWISISGEVGYIPARKRLHAGGANPDV